VPLWLPGCASSASAQGNKADEKKLKTLLSTLNARCTDCHSTDGRGD